MKNLTPEEWVQAMDPAEPFPSCQSRVLMHVKAFLQAHPHMEFTTKEMADRIWPDPLYTYRPIRGRWFKALE